MLNTLRIAVFWCALAGSAAAGPGDLLFTLTPPDSQPGTGFGSIVTAVDDNVLVSELFVVHFKMTQQGEHTCSTVRQES
jgi:hypothetical protein